MMNTYHVIFNKGEKQALLFRKRIIGDYSISLRYLKPYVCGVSGRLKACPLA